MKYLSSVLLSFLSFVAAAPFEKVKRATVQSEYDFIIAGGGTAGMLLANRLSESGTQTVLVLEAGPVPTVVAAYETPQGVQSVAGTTIDWRYYTAPQTNLNGRILKYNRGRGLGGSSITNGLYYGRGSASVYDKWVTLGNPGWGWDDLYPLAINHTHLNAPLQAFDQSYKTYDAAAYGNGPLQIGFQGYVTSSSNAFIEACPAIGIPIVTDLNTGNNTGVKQGSATLDGRLRRSSSYDSFYKQAQNRTNLHVLHYASVQAISFDQSSNGTTRATGVVFTDQETSLQLSVNATKEVIVSMGAFASPQLLMVSGVGPSEQLSNFGISPVYINENVGQNLNDHSVFSIMAQVEESASLSFVYANQSSFLAAQEQYFNDLIGPDTTCSGITNGFQQLSNETLQAIGAEEIIDRGLVNRSHVEFLYEGQYYPSGPSFSSSNGQASSTTAYYVPQNNLSYISLTASSLVALSRGNVSLRSASMADSPIINPNYYADPTDRAIAINSFKDLRKLLSQPQFSSFAIGPNNGEVAPGYDNIPPDADDDTIFDWIKASTVPNWHASGTNVMLPESAGGVVDARLRVYGIESLRVIDCSIIPELPDVNIQGPVYMIADRGAQFVKEDWGI